MVRLMFSDRAEAAGSKFFKPSHSHGWRSVRLLLEPTSKNWWEDPDIVVAFNLPRISAALERLMGTNVVRLTDRNYMKELRERIEDDYRTNLQKRIKARELKELERERVLIIEGKSTAIPEELANDPIFLVHKKTDVEIAKIRAKLKTNREKNADRLKVQGVKWERERQQYEAEEAQRVAELREQYAEQRKLEEQYTAENATKGMDLLRIQNEDWRPCEQKLKEFLEQERAKMKERSFRIPTAYSSDPKNIKNILAAREKFKELEMHVRKQIDDQQKLKRSSLKHQQKISAGQSAASSTSAKQQDEACTIVETAESIPDESAVAVHRIGSTEDISDDSSGDAYDDEGSTISMSRQRFAELLKQEMDNDVAAGLLISKEQYDHLHYQDAKIMRLRSAGDIKELYELAEQIIIGEQVEAAEEEIDDEEAAAAAAAK